VQTSVRLVAPHDLATKLVVACMTPVACRHAAEYVATWALVVAPTHPVTMHLVGMDPLATMHLVGMDPIATMNLVGHRPLATKGQMTVG